MSSLQSSIEPPFQLRREDQANAAVVVVKGDVDLVTAPELRKELAAIPAGTNIVVDLCETRFMDSTGLRVLLIADSASNNRIRVACKPAGSIRRLFEVSLAGQGLRIYDSREDALADFQPTAAARTVPT